MKRVALVAACALAACSKPSHITIHYTLPDSLQPSDVAVLTTTVTVADGAAGFSPGTGRTVANGVVLSTTSDAVPKAVLTFNHANGFVFAKTFEFTILAPSHAPQVMVDAKAYDSSHSGANTIAHAKAMAATFSSSGSVTLTLVDDRCAGSLCPTEQTCCNGVCASPGTDPSNCGACGTTCTGVTNTCAASACKCNGGSACAAGQTCVSGAGGGCIDTSTDPFNCGTLGHVCGTGETCTASVCGCGSGTSCGSGSLCCNGACAPGSGCPCGSTTCAAAVPICCNGTTCANTAMGDASNCGACGTTCGTNETCAGGHCACGSAGSCNAGDACCAGASPGCKTLDTDPANCGACGHACIAGETCSGGKCLCGSSGADCATSNGICCATGTASDGTPTLGCVDPSQPANCSACGNACASTAAGTETCNAQEGCSCQGTSAFCVPGQTCCANSGCVDFMTDTANCGSCGKACSKGQSCSGGTCQSSSGTCTPACTNGLTCSGGNCVCGTTMCVGTVLACCNGACADLATAATCGSCSTTCSGFTPNCQRCSGKTTYSCGLACGL